MLVRKTQFSIISCLLIISAIIFACNTTKDTLVKAERNSPEFSEEDFGCFYISSDESLTVDDIYSFFEVADIPDGKKKSKELDRYAEGDLFFGFSNPRHTFIKAKLNNDFPGFNLDDDSRLFTIDYYNYILGIDMDKVCTLSDFTRLIEDIKTRKFEDRKFPNNITFSDKNIERLKRWYNKLQSKADYLDLKKVILNMNGDIYAKIEAKVRKNCPSTNIDTRNFMNKQMFDIVTVFRCWARDDPRSTYSYEKNLTDFAFNIAMNSFFRRTSKLGIDFAQEENMTVHFITGYANNGYSALDLAIKEKGESFFQNSRITCSELRHCFRKNYMDQSFVKLIPYKPTAGISISGLSYLDKKKIRNYRKKYENLRSRKDKRSLFESLDLFRKKI